LISHSRIADVVEARHDLRAPLADVALLYPDHGARETDDHEQHHAAYQQIVGALHGVIPLSHTIAQKASSTRIITAEYTTAVVAARPTPAAPPPARSPQRHPISVT